MLEEADPKRKRQIAKARAHENIGHVKGVVAEHLKLDIEETWNALDQMRQERNLISHGVWMMRFGGDGPDGKPVTTKGLPHVLWHSKMLEEADYVVAEAFDFWRFDRFMKHAEVLLTTFRQFSAGRGSDRRKEAQPRCRSAGEQLMFLTKDALLLDFNAMRLAAARESVLALGLLRPAAEAIVYHCLDERLDDHPRARCLAYRQHGEQLSIDEKRAVGLRSDAFFSRAAYDELTDAGRREPLKAHETTLLRAVFTMFRYGVVTRARAEVGPPEFNDEFEHETTHLQCPACNAVDGIVAKGDQVALFPPKNCVCKTANYILKPHIDWFAELD